MHRTMCAVHWFTIRKRETENRKWTEGETRMITPIYEANGKRGTSRPKTEHELLTEHVRLQGRASIGPDAARKIALRIEEQGGFWDHPGKAAWL